MLDIHGCAESGCNVGRAAGTTASGRHFDLWLVRIHKGGFDSQELIASGPLEPGGAQLTAVPHWPRPLPCMYHFADIGRLGYRTGLAEGGWGPPAKAPGAYDRTGLDVRGRADGAQAVLSLSPPLTCPCNDIHYTEQSDEGEWASPTPLTVSDDYHDQPMSPQVGWDAGNDVHALWLQRTADHMLEVGPVHLEYWRRQDGVCTDAGAFSMRTSGAASAGAWRWR